MVRILGEDPEAGEDAAMSPARRWAASGQSIAGRSPSNARSRSLNKVRLFASQSIIAMQRGNSCQKCKWH